MISPNAQARRFFVSGRVQGVGFRWFVQDVAQRLGVVGFVRNLIDGRVEVLAEGGAEDLQNLAAEIRRGPGLSRVDAVEEADAEPAGRYSEFRIQHGERVIG